MKKTRICLTAMMLVLPLYGTNIVRNGQFDHGTMFNGSVMRLGKYDVADSIHHHQKPQQWQNTLFEGWCLRLPKPDMDATLSCVDTATRGKNALRMTGYGILDSDLRLLPETERSATLSFDVMTSQALGKASLNLVAGSKNMFQRRVVGTNQLELPTDTKGEFQRISVSVALPQGKSRPADLLAGLSLQLEKGTIVLDAVQIEPGTQATAFAPRPGEWLSVALDDVSLDHLPRYYANGDNKLKRAGKRTLTVSNTSGRTLTGTLNVYMDQWSHPGKTLLNSFTLKKWRPGKSISIKIKPGDLEPDAYIALAELIRDGEALVPIKGVFDIQNTSSGSIGQHMLRAYNALRFCVFPGTANHKTFGVGNGMVGTSQHWGGYQLDNYTLARETKVVGLAGGATNESQQFYCAIAGAQQYGSYWIDGASSDKALNNPATRNAIDIFNPDGRAELKQRAVKLGKQLALGPGTNGVKLRNESPYFNGGAICPTAAADDDFRNWCKKRYRTLKTLNQNWATSYGTWDQIEQIVSARMVNQSKVESKSGAAAIDWYANMGKLGKDTAHLMEQNPGRAMDWLRWRSEASLRMYHDFIRTAKRHAPAPLYGTNLCWPNFWPQISMPFYRLSDAPMLDMQYAAGHGKDLGNSDEMIDILEMAESTVPGKPIWGIESYVQPSFPDAFPAFQNWGLLAHGMTNNLVFGWKPYSDHGPKAFASGPASWKLPKSPPMWFMIDTDGTKLPLWHSNLRSAQEIEAFHNKYDGFSLQRLASRTGWYLSPDTAELIILRTANKPYNSKLMHSRVSQAAQLRMSGVTMNYLDDETLDTISPRHYDTVLLPPSPVLSDKAAEQLAKFVKSGGTLVLLGPTGVYDPWLKRRAHFGGQAWQDLNWRVPKQWKDLDTFFRDYDTPSKGQITFCRNLPGLPNGTILRDTNGEEMARERKWGKGRLIAATVYPSRYSQTMVQPLPALADYLAWLKKAADLPVNGVWLPNPQDIRQAPTRIGHGDPIVEIVVREKKGSEVPEQFVFILNQGGAGQGTVQIPLGNAQSVTAENALTGQPIIGRLSNGNWELPLQVKPWFYRVIRLKMNGMR
jgi:hypothetical protein